jgi:hypothetical protein
MPFDVCVLAVSKPDTEKKVDDILFIHIRKLEQPFHFLRIVGDHLLLFVNGPLALRNEFLPAIRVEEAHYVEKMVVNGTGIDLLPSGSFLRPQKHLKGAQVAAADLIQKCFLAGFAEEF